MNLMNNNDLFNKLIEEVDDLRLAVCLDKAKKNNDGNVGVRLLANLFPTCLDESQCVDAQWRRDAQATCSVCAPRRKRNECHLGFQKYRRAVRLIFNRIRQGQ